MDTEYDCVFCGTALYFDATSLHFKHKATLSACAYPLAHPVSVVVGILLPAKSSPVVTGEATGVHVHQ